MQQFHPRACTCTLELSRKTCSSPVRPIRKKSCLQKGSAFVATLTRQETAELLHNAGGKKSFAIRLSFFKQGGFLALQLSDKQKPYLLQPSAKVEVTIDELAAKLARQAGYVPVWDVVQRSSVPAGDAAVSKQEPLRQA